MGNGLLIEATCRYGDGIPNRWFRIKKIGGTCYIKSWPVGDPEPVGEGREIDCSAAKSFVHRMEVTDDA